MKNCILFICMSTMLACKNNSKIMLEKSFVDSVKNFSIQYPASWQFDSSRFVLQETVLNNADVFQESISLGLEQNFTHQKAAIFIDASQTQMKLVDSNFKNISTQSIKINNLDAAKAVYTTKQNEVLYKNTLYAVAIDTTIFYIQCNAVDTSFESHQAIFNQIINTIKPTRK
jgi:PsbP-like protein